MERRKILLGSGAVLATVLAGCSGADGDEEDDDGYDSRDDDDDHETDDDYDDIPGFTPPEDSIDDYDGSIDRIKHEGRAVHVEMTTTKKLEDELYQELGQLSTIVGEAIYDAEKFTAAVDTVHGTIYDEDGYELITFYVEVEWAVDFIDDELSAEEFADKILETVE